MQVCTVVCTAEYYGLSAKNVGIFMFGTDAPFEDVFPNISIFCTKVN